MRHAKFLARTVIVKNGDVDGATRILNKIMGKEGFWDQYRRTRYYEKPTHFRIRINYEICKSLYDEDMNRRIKFILRKNRETPFPGCDLIEMDEVGHHNCQAFRQSVDL